MRTYVQLASAVYILLLLTVLVDATNFTQCLDNIRDESWRISQNITEGGTNNRGIPVALSDTTTAISYQLCKKACGIGPAPTQWRTFSGQFSSWLLPWLALVSQLPFGAEDRLDNLIAVFLAVGSPTLAAYSLALTVLNRRWAARRFPSRNYDWGLVAVGVLHRLQQFAVVIPHGQSYSSLVQQFDSVPSHELQRSSHVVLRWSNEWWSNLERSLDHSHTWSLAAVTSIAWVVIAYLFAVIDFFMGDIDPSSAKSVNPSDTQGVGSLWLWLLPIVVGWLQVSPKCDSERLRKEFRDAEISYREHLRETNKEDEEVADGSTVGNGFEIADRSAPSSDSEIISISFLDGPLATDLLHRDERCPVPIFNYARLFTWVQLVEHVSEAFDPGRRPRTRQRGEAPSPWGPGVWSRMIVASLLALSLQWGTAGAAVVVFWFTPTIGLGCHTGSYFLYATLSTFIWMLLVAASILSHYATTSRPGGNTWAIQWLSIVLRRIGKTLAAINAVFVLMFSMFQFTNVFQRCYCNSSVLMLGAKAYNVLELSSNDLSIMKDAWIAAVFLASGAATFFWFFINLFIEPPK